MSCADHLWKIDDDRLAIFTPDEDVEFVEITVYQSVFRQTHNELHECCIEVRWGVYGVDLAPRPVSGAMQVSRVFARLTEGKSQSMT